jgi:hypothetical protein
VPQNLPDLLPPELTEPRVFIHPGDVTLACRYRSGAVDAVLSFACDVYLQSPNVLAIRIKGARAGLVPLPLGKVLDAITHTAQELELPLEWRRAGGDPVALVNVVPPHARGHEPVEIDSIELREGEILVAGRTGRVGPVALRPNGSETLSPTIVTGARPDAKRMDGTSTDEAPPDAAPTDGGSSEKSTRDPKPAESQPAANASVASPRASESSPAPDQASATESPATSADGNPLEAAKETVQR